MVSEYTDITPSRYYYDIDISEHIYKSYKDVLILKIHSANKLMEKLVVEENMHDTTRMSKVGNSIKFNTELLKEAGLTQKEISKLVQQLKKEEK